MRARWILWAQVLVCLLSICANSCTRCIDIRIFNHTGAQIVILGFDPAGEQHGWVLDDGASSVVWYMYRWEIRKVAPVPVVWSYQPGTIKYIGEEYLTKNWLHCQHAAAQIETDGSIWILPPGTSTIVPRPPSQPGGYPARPDKTRSSGPRRIPRIASASSLWISTLT